MSLFGVGLGSNWGVASGSLADNTGEIEDHD